MNNVYPLVENLNGCRTAPKSRNIASKAIRIALFSAIIAGGATASAATLSYVGAELSTANSGTAWGTNNNEFRSTDSGTKGYVLPGNPNAYGTDGSYFFPTGQTFVSLPTYVSNLSFSTTDSQGFIGGGVGLDDPSSPVGTKTGPPAIPTVQVGSLYQRDFGGPLSTPIYMQSISFTLSETKSFRIGFVASTGDAQKPGSWTLSKVNSTDPATLFGLGAITATTGAIAGIDDYDTPDWYFFDVSGTAGDTFYLYIQRSNARYNDVTRYQGMVFDSVAAVPEPSTFALLGLATLGGYLIRRKKA